jgi:hypothetical protein
MNAYPQGFANWAEERRNAFFADQATLYRERLVSRRFPFNDIKPDERAQYLIKNLLPRAGLVIVWGPPKCGKSFWTFDALMHVTLGWEYRENRVVSGAVIYCALEGAQGFKNRIEAFRTSKLSEADSGSPHFYLMSASLSLVRDHKAFVEEVGKQLADIKPAVVCIDTLNRSLTGSESSDEDMAAYIQAADAIRAAFDCLVVVVHHCGHDGQRPRGHSSLMGALDVQIAVRRDAADNIVAKLELAKDGPIGLTTVSRLKVVELGLDQDGDPIMSCVIEAVDAPDVTVPKGRRLPKAAASALRALEAAIADAGEIPPASNHVPPDVRTVSPSLWRDYSYRMGVSTSDEPRAKRQAFKRACDELLDARMIAVWEPHVWIVRRAA